MRTQVVAHPAGHAWALGAFVVVLCGTVVTGLLASGGSFGWALAPVAVLGAAVAVWGLPLRVSMFGLAFLALTLENPGDVPAAGLWRSPLYPFGALMLAHLNLSYPHRALIFSGLDVALVLLGVVAVYRRVTRSAIDRAPRAPAATPMMVFAGLTLAGAAWMWLYGMSRGEADVASSLWQVQRVVYLPLVFFLVQAASRGPLDVPALGRILVSAACVKAALAIYVVTTVEPPAGQDGLSYATTHADSMLFAGAFTVVVVTLIEAYGRRRWAVAALVLPLLATAMVVNNRRIVWVELLAALTSVLVLCRRARVKRAILRAAIVGSPLLLAYVAAGWSSNAAIFRPLGTLRSVADSDVDASTGWRDWENYDLFYTVRQHPLLGTGYGHGFTEIAKLPDISSMYSLYAYIPHNSILGLWAYGGIIGFAFQWTLLAVGLYLAARANRFAKFPANRTAALGAVSLIVAYSVHCWGDMGLGTWTAVFTVGPALAVAAQTAVATGAWPLRLRAPDPPLEVA